jgi:hypothetical protein
MRKREPKSPDTEPKELPVWPEQVMGGKYVRLLESQLAQLRRNSDDHGNRELFLDDVFVAYLLAFFNPSIRSLRTIEDCSQTRQMQRHLTMNKLCRSTLSDFNRLVDPQRLEPILQALRAQISRKDAGTPRNMDSLSELLRKTIAVDGTFLPAVAEVAWAVRCHNQREGEAWRARLDVHLAVESWLPELIVIPEPKQSESASAAENIRDGNIYLYDRGFSAYELINAHYKEYEDNLTPRAQFVVRYKDSESNSPELSAAEVRSLTAQDLAAGIVSDRVGRFQSSKASRHRILDVPLREVIVEYEEQGEKKTLRLITNLLEVSAEVIAKLYRYRWQIELFFRWLKCFGHFDHLISHQREGVLLHFYVAVIATMLIYLHSGFRPSKYLFVLLSQVACGAATLEEILPILRERERQRKLERESAAKRRAKKKSETR